MPKRPRSASPDVDAGPSRPKRHNGSQLPRDVLHDATSNSSTSSSRRSISDLFPFQEIFLRILSFLPPNDLAKVQRVDRYWSKMSVDPQLWKRLYLARYPHPHHSRLIYTATSTISSENEINNASSPRTPTPRSLRPIARLPSRAFPPPSPKRSPSLSQGQLTPGSSTPQMRIEGSGHVTPLSSRADKGKGKEQLEEEVGHGVRNDGVDWKLMLRLGTNWSNGNALSQSTIPLPPSPSPSIHSDAPSALPPLSLSSTSSLPRNSSISEQHIALSPSYIFISSPLSPLVQVHSSTSHGQPLGIIPPPPGWSNPKRPDNVTCIVSDQSVIPIDDGVGDNLPARITVFYQSGGFVVLTISPAMVGNGLSWKREFINPPNNRPRSIKRRATTHEALEGDSVVLATMHWPILISCTREFNLSVYSLSLPPTSGNVGQVARPRHLQTLKSEVSYHPANLTLFPTPPSFCNHQDQDHLDKQSIQEEKDESDHFKASLTYCTPLYPSSWTIAVQEFTIDNDKETVERGESFHVGRNSNDNDEDDEIIWPKRIKPLIGVKEKAVGIGSDGRWCILVGERENKIQVFSLPHRQSEIEPPHSHLEGHPSQQKRTSSSSMRKKDARSHDQPITHSQTLISSNSSDITSLAINSGRCVSSNEDGKVLVWELDEHHHHEHEQDGNMGKMVGYVEVRKGGRRQTTIWKGPTGPQSQVSDESEEGRWPHPQSISSAARALFLPRLPVGLDLREADQSPPPVRYLTFDEEKIVGLVRGDEEVMKVWSFS
ncbi:hypothetical protein I302_108816 [Kwoniella bestiolae CBS 10118]|uniref:F-box domain-containing protein n=1 Tax=Kwoniella bestiolae CBS 10118 TaxID=1296100 RepID=A0A1B9FU70_9TREE|nr:hypothetical protein I302_07954 [Kwoniella bestiolae CBS 10118]OCF22308.1 hypothetical protein I302_07954 [Kwoniella bestiolae CBS 10118]